MRVFVTGASGAIGRRLIPQLIDAGHDVIGTHNAAASAHVLRSLGAAPVKLDLLDARAVREAVLETEPEAIVHEATALADVKFSRNMDKVTAKTNELRTEGTDALVAAAREAGVRRLVAQSVAAFSRYAREGGPVKTEDDPVDPTPPANFRRGAAAMSYLERAVTDFGGIALRYGAFYGAANDGTIEPVRKRQFPIVGDGGGDLVLDPSRRRRCRNRSRAGTRRPGYLQHRRRRSRRGAGVAARARPGPRREATAALPHLARAHARGRGRGRALHRGARCLEREGEARARLDAALPDLAHGIQGGLLDGRRRRPTESPHGPADEPLVELGPRPDRTW